MAEKGLRGMNQLLWAECKYYWQIDCWNKWIRWPDYCENSAEQESWRRGGGIRDF